MEESVSLDHRLSSLGKPIVPSLTLLATALFNLLVSTIGILVIEDLT